MKRMFSILSAVGVCSLVALDASARVTIVSASPRVLKQAPVARGLVADAASREKWVGTKPILRDAKSGKLRKPTDAEARELVRTIRQLTARPSGGPRTLLRTDSAGQAVADSGMPQVILVRATEDGENETLCVQTLEEALDFLGLIPAGSEQ